MILAFWKELETMKKEDSATENVVVNIINPKSKTEKNKHMKYVYMLRFDRHDYAKPISYYKIGISVNSDVRLTDLQISCPEKLDIMATSPCVSYEMAYLFEFYIHTLLKKYNTNGEWFKLNDILYRKIRNVISEPNNINFNELRSLEKKCEIKIEHPKKYFKELKRNTKYSRRKHSKNKYSKNNYSIRYCLNCGKEIPCVSRNSYKNKKFCRKKCAYEYRIKSSKSLK